MTNAPAPGFRVEIDGVDKEGWHALLDRFASFLDIYRQTRERKKCLETSRVSRFRDIQAELPGPFKKALSGEEPLAGRRLHPFLGAGQRRRW